jgi:hypothetical protein
LRATNVDTEIGEGIENTEELQGVKYNEAISGSEKEKRKKAILEEHDRMIQNTVWTPVKLNNLPSNVKPFSKKWAMKRRQMDILELR